MSLLKYRIRELIAEENLTRAKTGAEPLTFKELAAALELNEKTVKELEALEIDEKREASVPTLLAICHFFRVSFDKIRNVPVVEMEMTHGK